ncbi:MAG TPA: serine/threonine-protein kinase [Kofleriaceae bacterium]
MTAAPQRTRHLAPGDKLGKYEVIRQIAIGGMAELYLARTLGIEGFEKLVVLKRILPQYGSNVSFVNMFLNEARLAATLHHPNVAQVYDIGLEQGDYFFAMEYVHGEDLDHIAIASEEQGVPLSMDAALTLVAGLCSGLHYAHEKMNAEGKPLSIVHRDVSPSNVLVSYDGAVKLVDFGIARASSRPGTTQGGLKGKIAYMSPEQCRANAQLDRRSDLYSVGTILYQLTTGRLPFVGETEYQVLNQIVNEDVPPPSRVVPGYPPHLERIVCRALARDAAHRYTTALELQTDVEDFAHETRLRISPLVLARLMGTLFPARLEEWDHAKAQGAFFVEQHVVRTLIESGKTPDRSDPETMSHLAAIAEAQARQDAAAKAAQDALRQFGDDDPTSLNQQSFSDVADTAIGVPPITTTEGVAFKREVTPLPPPPELEMPADATSITVPSLPDPEPVPAVYPIVSELMSATPGSLVTSAGKYGQIPVTEAPRGSDVTERLRVRQRRHSSPTTFVRTRSRKPWLAIGGCLVAGGAIAAFIALRGGDPPAVTPAPEPEQRVEMPAQVTETPPETPAEPPAAPAPVEPAAAAPVAVPKPSVVKQPEPKPVAATPKKPEPKKPEPKLSAAKSEPKVAVKPKPAPKKAPAAKPEPKKPEPKEKETTWNTDSPFMPVRTEKK